MGGGQGKVVYLDTEGGYSPCHISSSFMNLCIHSFIHSFIHPLAHFSGNFRPERIESIADRYGLDAEQTLDNIIVCRVFSHEEQMDIVKPIAGLLSDPNHGTPSTNGYSSQPQANKQTSKLTN